jgi:N-acetylglutamate synthase
VLAFNVGDVGSRVVVRRRVGPVYTDLVGELREVAPTSVVVLTKHGEVRVPLDEIHRAKKVPENRAESIRRLERAAAQAWPAVEIEPLGEWRLRASGGFTGRANSVLTLGDPGLPVPQAIEHAAAFYRERGLRPRMDLPLPLANPVIPHLTRAGWREECQVLVQTLPLGRLIAATPAGAGCTLSATPSPAVLAIISGRRGRLPEAAIHVLTAVPLLRFCEYAESGGLLAMARGAVTDGYLGLFAVETVEAARRRGLAAQVVGALARWAGEAGAGTAYLQVESTNTAAVALYAKLGFRTHHRYARYSCDF